MADEESPKEAAEPPTKPENKSAANVSIREKIERYLEDYRAKKAKEAPADKAAGSTARATWFIGFLTAATIGVGISQYITFKQQLGAMEEDRRPWLGVQLRPVGPLAVDKTGVTFNYVIALKNSGRTPAVHVYLEAKLATENGEEPFDCNDQAISALSSMSNFGFSVFPGDTFEYQRSDDLLSADISKAVAEGQLSRLHYSGKPDTNDAISVSVSGCVTYSSPYGIQEIHHSWFNAAIARTNQYGLYTRFDTIDLDAGDIPVGDIHLDRSEDFGGNGAD